MIFIDQARIFVKAGDGGKGCESFYRDKYMRYPRPDGGDGGKGGDIVFIAAKSIHTLLDYKYTQHYKAQKGGNASSKCKSGKNGIKMTTGELKANQRVRNAEIFAEITAIKAAVERMEPKLDEAITHTIRCQERWDSHGETHTQLREDMQRSASIKSIISGALATAFGVVAAVLNQK